MLRSTSYSQRINLCLYFPLNTLKEKDNSNRLWQPPFGKTLDDFDLALSNHGRRIDSFGIIDSAMTSSMI
jgi:hypothetical protein